MMLGPPARWIAPSTPPPPANRLFAAFTMASTSCCVISPSTNSSDRPLIVATASLFRIRYLFRLCVSFPHLISVAQVKRQADESYRNIGRAAADSHQCSITGHHLHARHPFIQLFNCKLGR